MCFLPNSRASIDHAPGPIIANVALSVARMTGIEGSTVRERMTQTSIKLTSVPTMGVHRPSKTKIDKPTPINSVVVTDAGTSLTWMTAQ